MSDFKKEYELWDEFLSVWPLARLAIGASGHDDVERLYPGRVERQLYLLD